MQIESSKLYFLHIPKNGGTTMIKTISTALKFAGVKHYTNSIPPHSDDLNDNVFLSGHFGTYPIDKLNGFDVACIFRDPVERLISNFNYIYPMLYEREEYLKLPGVPERMRYYLFDDPNFLYNKNIQTKFICNSANDIIFGKSEEYSDEYRDKYAKHLMTRDWFLENNKTNIDFAKSQLDSFNIVGTLDNYGHFAEKMYDWVNNKCGTEIKYNKNIFLNQSITIEAGNSYTSQDLLSILTKKEYDRIVNDNSLDYEVYEYAKKR